MPRHISKYSGISLPFSALNNSGNHQNNPGQGTAQQKQPFQIAVNGADPPDKGSENRQRYSFSNTHIYKIIRKKSKDANTRRADPRLEQPAQFRVADQQEQKPHKHQNRQGDNGSDGPKFVRFRIEPDAEHHQSEEQRGRCHNRQPFLIADQSFEGPGVDCKGQKAHGKAQQNRGCRNEKLPSLCIDADNPQEQKQTGRKCTQRPEQLILRHNQRYHDQGRRRDQ